MYYIIERFIDYMENVDNTSTKLVANKDNKCLMYEALEDLKSKQAKE